MHSNQLFFELMRVSVGKQERLSRIPSEKEWDALFDMAERQSLLGVCFAGVQRLCNSDIKYYNSLSELQFMEYLGIAMQIQMQNSEINQQCVNLKKMLALSSIESYILKGQSLLPYYTAYGASELSNLATLRQPGDIDVWCPGMSITELVKYVEGLALPYEAKYAHVSFEPYGGTQVELHPVPATLRCPWYNRRLQKWFILHTGEPNDEFNLVFLLVHIFHHALFEGIGLRQIMDYYFVLQSCTDELVRTQTKDTLKHLGLKRFTSAVMWVLSYVFGMPAEHSLFPLNEKDGRLLLSEIMAGGNFGHYDNRYAALKSSNLFIHGLGGIRKKVVMARFGFWEVACSPSWSLWQICWRKRNGYY